MKITFCTIIARNYLALALTLAESLRRFHPESAFHLFIVDPFDLPEEAFAQAGIQHVAPAALFETAHYNRLAFGYDITELSTAVKPFLLRHLLEEGYDQVYYFDPDILVMQPLDGLFERLVGHSVVLTPHILAPMPLDGHLPSEVTLLQAGAYNLGFIGVSAGEEALRFLNWWADRLDRFCHVALERGLFVDQKWVDLVPGLFEGVLILRSPVYNVAYWNLHERVLSQLGDTYMVNGEPIAFYHFSGFNPARPQVLSKHQSRIDEAGQPALLALLAAYAGALARHGHGAYQALPYGYAVFSNGVPIDAVARSLMTQALAEGRAFPDPYHVEAPDGYFAWLNGPAKADQGGPTLTRYLLGYVQATPGLRRAFPLPFRQTRAFLAWARTAVRAGQLDAAYLEAAYASAPAEAPVDATAPETRPGVNVAGYLTAELGVGEAARGYVAALKRLGVPLALTNFAAGTTSRNQDPSLSAFTGHNPHPTNLVCINADQVPRFLAQGHQAYLAGRYNIGVWWWELPTFPAHWHDRFALFDEIWVGSSFAQEAIARTSPIPVVKVPPVVDVPAGPAVSRAHFGLDDGEFLFLFVFDFMSVFERKNPLAAIAAFQAAFRPDEAVRLVIKCINGEQRPEELARLRAAAEGARVTVIEAYMSRDEKNGLIALCDGYVSLHRSEGFGLTMAEAMALGKPVIATGWSGNMDFMTVKNSYPVAFELVALAEDCGPYARGQLWAEPDTAHAAALMREVFTHPQAARARGEAAAEDMRRFHSPERVAQAIAERLASLNERRAAAAPPRRPPDPRKGTLLLRFLPPVELVMRPEFVDNGTRYGAPGLLAKRALQQFYRLYFPERMPAVRPPRTP